MAQTQIDENKIFDIPVNDVVVEDRARKVFKEVETLATSLLNVGQLQPIIIDKDKRLIAGERRLRACKRIDWPTVRAVYRNDVDDATRLEIELEENIARSEFTWQEEVDLKERLFVIKQKKYGVAVKGQGGGYGVKDLADEFGASVSAVHEDVALARAIKEHPELAKCVGKTVAIKKLRELKRQAVIQEIAARARKDLGFTSDCLVHGDALTEMAEFADASVNMIHWDPPYGQDFHKGGGGNNAADVTRFDDETYNARDLISKLLKSCYRVLKDNSVLIMWCNLSAFQSIKSLCEDAQFTVCPYPLVWCKGAGTGAPTTPSYYNKGVEGMVHALKGTRALNKMGVSNFFLHDRVPANKKIHPTEKPTRLIRDLIEQHTLPGELVVDPTCGSASTLVAALECKRKAWGCELSDEYYAKALLRLESLLGNVVKLPDTFEELVPGSEAWTTYWKAYPDQQPSMIAHMHKLRKAKDASEDTEAEDVNAEELADEL